jgi:hypothetical protein
MTALGDMLHHLGSLLDLHTTAINAKFKRAFKLTAELLIYLKQNGARSSAIAKAIGMASRSRVHGENPQSTRWSTHGCAKGDNCAGRHLGHTGYCRPEPQQSMVGSPKAL